ncbi:MAG: STAS domain-containing protein [Verrucomicrobia bacterium]|nr:STAS domain-containing protein [Verrucomicrobiota bacterium]MBU4290176.1 STAS domain-containing protein [Verrucomicrobiota bacterium]MBU4427771.1 STAS domain-containing protein [Verrucomicrobiota bacterium]MBU4497922.1 STAS domain-containing protein [Verrucomicrobiota bacterium]MCG2681688.1 STAS domain-containing protein [Kiritimatiellia bacterium]
MRVVTQLNNQRLDITLQGRMDAYACGEAQKILDPAVTADVVFAVADMAGVDYLSSAGLRLLLGLSKKLRPNGGALIIAGAREYCRKVMDLAGFADTFPMFDAVEPARAFCDQTLREKQSLDRWDQLECLDLEWGRVRVLPGSGDPGAAEILGDVKDVLYARITPAHLCSKRFMETEYSIGLGGLGDRLEDYLPLMGEMITIGGTMVWLPTDGHDTPDFLIPKSDRGQVTLHTGFNVTLAGKFNEFMMYESRDPAGATMTQLYRDLFHSARHRRPDFKGALALSLRAQMGTVYGSGIKKSPILEFAPANGEMVIHASNVKEWFDFDAVPRQSQVTGLIFGVGADLTADLSAYDQAQFNRVFYLNPANTGGRNEMLHNHAVIFNEQPLAERAGSLSREIEAVVDNGEFLDMRHLLDSSTITRAFLGISYIQEFRSDPHGAGR